MVSSTLVLRLTRNCAWIHIPVSATPSATQPHVRRQPWEGVCVLKHRNVLHVGLTQAWTVSLKLDYSELKPEQALLEGGWIREKNRVWLVHIVWAGRGPAVLAVVLTVLRFLPAASLFRKVWDTAIWWMRSFVHSSLEPTCTWVSAQRRVNNNLDDEQNNVVFINLETCPRPEKENWVLVASQHSPGGGWLFLSHMAEAHGV